MIPLGLNGEREVGEVRIGFRTGLVRTMVITLGGASTVGVLLGVFELAEHEPVQFFELLTKWGFTWLLALAAMGFAWDLAKRGVAHLGKLADAVKETAVAVSRIADKDDREHDRLATETAFVGQRLERLSLEFGQSREEQREHYLEVLGHLKELTARPSEVRGNGDATGRRGT